MRDWDEVRAELFAGRDTAILAAQDQLRARLAEHAAYERQVLDGLDPDTAPG